MQNKIILTCFYCLDRSLYRASGWFFRVCSCVTNHVAYVEKTDVIVDTPIGLYSSALI